MRKQVKLSPSDTATQRTKNRLHENGPIFFIIEEHKSVSFWGKTFPGILVQSMNKQYSGWFPIDELIMEEV